MKISKKQCSLTAWRQFRIFETQNQFLISICIAGVLGGGCANIIDPTGAVRSTTRQMLSTPNPKRHFPELPKENGAPVNVYSNVFWNDHQGMYLDYSVHRHGRFTVYTNQFRFVGDEGEWLAIDFDRIKKISSWFASEQVFINEGALGFTFVNEDKKKVASDLRQYMKSRGYSVKD